MAEEDKLNDLKNLSPEERIEKLKEIAKKDEEEIKKAHELIKLSEEELQAKQQERRQMPIPQLKSVDVSTLFGRGTDEDMMFKAKQFRDSPTKEEDVSEKVEEKRKGRATLLEQKVAHERATMSDETARKIAEADAEQRAYQLSMTEITSKAANIYQAAKQSDYVSSDQMKAISAMYDQLNEKIQDIRTGDYSPDYESFAEQKSAFSEIMKALKDKYHGR